MNAIHVKKLREHAILPTYGTACSAGADLYACLDAPVTLAPGCSAPIPTGIAMEVPPGCAGLVYARSGLACKRGLAPANKVGVIDSDYRGDHRVPAQPRCRAPDHLLRRADCPDGHYPRFDPALPGSGRTDRHRERHRRLRFHRKVTPSANFRKNIQKFPKPLARRSAVCYSSIAENRDNIGIKRIHLCLYWKSSLCSAVWVCFSTV